LKYMEECGGSVVESVTDCLTVGYEPIMDSMAARFLIWEGKPLSEWEEWGGFAVEENRRCDCSIM